MQLQREELHSYGSVPHGGVCPTIVQGTPEGHRCLPSEHRAANSIIVKVTNLLWHLNRERDREGASEEGRGTSFIRNRQ